MNITQRILLTRIVTGFILFFLILRFFEHATPSRFLAPPLFLVQLDIAYWLYKLADLPGLIVVNKTGAVFFDICLFLSGILLFFFPLRKIWILSFTILLFIYAISFNYFGMHHTHPLAGFMLILFPFWAADNVRFNMLWEGMRYYTCYLYGMSFIWKTCIGDSFFNWKQGIGSFKLNLVNYLYQNPDTLLSGFYRWCLQESWLINSGWILVILLEGFMLVGFFTKKFDALLFWIPVIIHFSTYLFANAFFIELLVLDFTFLTGRQLKKIDGFLVVLQSKLPGRYRTRQEKEITGDSIS
ncbi:MAG TPA: hypothetical protein VK543_14445 [Puia sp.]|nr:hypothetical protein [Puia sp.]